MYNVFCIINLIKTKKTKFYFFFKFSIYSTTLCFGSSIFQLSVINLRNQRFFLLFGKASHDRHISEYKITSGFGIYTCFMPFLYIECMYTYTILEHCRKSIKTIENHQYYIKSFAQQLNPPTIPYYTLKRIHIKYISKCVFMHWRLCGEGP